MKYPLMLLLLVACMVAVNAQDDLPVRDEEKIQFKPGLYLSFDDFIYDSPVDFDDVQGDLQEFFENPMNSKQLTVKRNLSTYDIEQASVWGYSDGKNVFLNRSLFKGINLDMIALKITVTPWVKIQTFGTFCYISYFSMIESRNLTTFYSYKKTSRSNFILNTRDGKFYDGNLDELKLLAADDSEALAELKKKRGDNEIKFFFLLNKYNERHPFQFR